MAGEQEAFPYFAGTPLAFQAAADVLLKLDDGMLLPAHSQLLASTSPVLCEMLYEAPSPVAAGDKIVLPLPGFSKLQAFDILKVRVLDRHQARVCVYPG
jgi:hypothetical protein